MLRRLSVATKPATSERPRASGSAGARRASSRWAARPTSPARRPDEDQVEVTLTRGFWMGKYEVTQGQWKRVVGRAARAKPTAGWGEGDDFPVGNVNFAEAEALLQDAHRARRTSRGACPRAGSSACPPRRSGSTPAGPGPRPPRRSATGSAASRRTSEASPTTAARTGRRWEGGDPGRQLPRQRLGHPRHARQHLRVVPRLVPREAAGRHGPRPSRREGDRPTGTAPTPASAAGARGPTTAGPAGPPSACASSRTAGTTTSASASSRFGPDDGGSRRPPGRLLMADAKAAWGVGFTGDPQGSRA